MLKNMFVGLLGDLKELAAPSDEGASSPKQTAQDKSLSQPKSIGLPRALKKKTASNKPRGSVAATFPIVRESLPVALSPAASFDDFDVVIRAAYKQVFGNVHLMESQRLVTAESRLKDGQLTIKEFVRALAKSELYRSLFVESFPNTRVVELNFKHFLGRAPESPAEVAAHIATLANEGFEAEIDSYLDSAEYDQNFGQQTIPYYVSYATQVGRNVDGYNRISRLVQGSSASDRSVDVSQVLSQTDLLKAPVYSPPLTIVVPKIPAAPVASVATVKSLGSKPKSPVKGKVAAQPAPVQPTDESRISIQIFPEDKAKTLADKYRDAFSGNSVVEFYGDSASQENLDAIIRAAYRQVFGNAYLMESERVIEAESQMRSGRINVMDFIRMLAKSDRYRSLFWDKYPPTTAIELNFKHLLGRAPASSDEISRHLAIVAEGGFSAEIDSYLDSDEYLENFGTFQVPYPRGYNTQVSNTALGFTRAFPLFGPACSSDKSTFGSARPTLQAQLLSDSPGVTPSLRAIPDSFPASMVATREPRIPKELLAMARQLLTERGGYQLYRNTVSTQSAFPYGYQ